MLLDLSILGIFLSGIFLFFNASKNAANLYLGSFFFLVSLYGLSQYGLLYSKSVPFVSGMLVTFPIIFPPLYLTGPMLLWYIRSVLSDHPGLRRVDAFHFLPMLVYFGASLPFSFEPLSEKVELATQVVNNVGIMQTYAATFLSRIFPISAIYLSRPVLLLAYAIWSIGLIVKYYLQNKQKGVFSGQQFMINWLVLLMGCILLLAVSHIIDIIHTFKLHFSDLTSGLYIFRVLSAIGLIGLMLLPFLFPAILYGLPRIPSPAKHPAKGAGINTRGETKETILQFENAYLRSVGELMEFYMQEHQPYLNPQFNINHLAVQIGIPVHHLAYYFRAVRKQTFSWYRNGWRVAHAKRLIREGRSNQLTLEAIATLSGFSNRDSFRSVFQRMEKISPRTFALQHKEESA